MTSAARFSTRLLGVARVFAILATTSAVTAACNNLFPDKPDPTYIEGSVEQLYNTGLDFLNKREWRDAARYFNEIDRQHPYSSWAARAQLMVAFSYYKARDYDNAILTLGRFTRLNPGHRDIAYAYYLRALSHFEQVNDVKRDQSNTREAINGFTIVTRRYPASKYATDSRRKIAVLYDHLAGAEMEVGRYYLERDQYLAAVNRFKTVVDRFQGSRHVPEALHRLTESYTALGLRQEARRTAAVLGYNFPKSRWYADSYDLIQGRGVSRVSVPKRSAPKTDKKPPATSAPPSSAPPPPDADKRATPQATDTKAGKEPSATTTAAPGDDTKPAADAKKAVATEEPPKPARRSFFRRAIDWVF